MTGAVAATVTANTTCAALLFTSAARTVMLAVPGDTPVSVSVLPFTVPVATPALELVAV